MNRESLETDFSKLTLGDLRPVMVKDASPGDLIEFADKCVVGGVKHLPAIYFKPILEAVISEFVVYFQADNSESLREMLKDIKGL